MIQNSNVFSTITMIRLRIVDMIKGVCAQAGLNCNDMFTLLTGLNFFPYQLFDLNHLTHYHKFY